MPNCTGVMCQSSSRRRNPVPGCAQLAGRPVVAAILEIDPGIQRGEPPRKVLDAGDRHRGTRTRASQHRAHRGRRAQDVVRVVEQQRIDRFRQAQRLRGCLDQQHVAPPRRGDPRTRGRLHLGTLVATEDQAALADRIAQQRQAQAGAATDIEYALPGLQPQRGHRTLADRPGRTAGGVIARGPFPVLQHRASADLRVGQGRGTLP